MKLELMFPTDTYTYIVLNIQDNKIHMYREPIREQVIEYIRRIDRMFDGETESEELMKYEDAPCSSIQYAGVGLSASEEDMVFKLHDGVGVVDFYGRRLKHGLIYTKTIQEKIAATAKLRKALVDIAT